MCVLQNPNAPESGEDCFQALTLENGNTQYNVVPEEKEIYPRVRLPSGLRCDRCVLRWHYQAGKTKEVVLFKKLSILWLKVTTGDNVTMEAMDKVVDLKKPSGRVLI